ncbi:hypothetical protein PG991_008187 [Apiospora marii]|uniref:Uncharacterized protein n=1 Tax=Apiospora marii TaxID=335849 RepID=A0ABR1RW04_9PEZI
MHPTTTIQQDPVVLNITNSEQVTVYFEPTTSPSHDPEPQSDPTPDVVDPPDQPDSALEATDLEQHHYELHKRVLLRFLLRDVRGYHAIPLTGNFPEEEFFTNVLEEFKKKMGDDPISAQRFKSARVLRDYMVGLTKRAPDLRSTTPDIIFPLHPNDRSRDPRATTNEGLQVWKAMLHERDVRKTARQFLQKLHESATFGRRDTKYHTLDDLFPELGIDNEGERAKQYRDGKAVSQRLKSTLNKLAYNKKRRGRSNTVIQA